MPISAVLSTPCHLLYTYDILLFFRARKARLRNIQMLLSKYKASSSQCFNLQKSNLYMGKCSARRAQMISKIIPITRASLPSVYLGVHLFFGTSRHSHFNQLLDSIRARLNWWKAKCPSFIGRLIMVKHVLSSIPLYISPVIPIPSKTILQIERLMHKFLWSSSSEKKRSNMVK